MLVRNLGKFVSSGMAVAAISGSLLTGATVPNTAPNVTYTATGTFSNPATSGADTLKLAGEPFSISIVANAASPPKQHGPNWAVMSPFKVTGSVHSGLLGPTPVNIASSAASIYQLVGPAYDLFTTAFPVKVVGISLTIQATISLPPGTISTPLIHPFNAVTLSPANASVTYSNGTDTTTLTVASGTLTATIPGGAPLASMGATPGNGTFYDVPMYAEPAVLVAFSEQTRRS